MGPAMRKLGMVGGTSWFSTALYYEQINKAVAKAKGGLTSAPLILESLDLAPVAALELAGRWDEVGKIVAAAAARLEAAGAKGLILCSNTTHKVAPAVEAAVSIPLIHIADVTADRLAADGVRKAGLIGTRFTMGEGFFRDRIAARGIDLALPDRTMAGEIDRIIFEELARGQVSRNSQRLLKTCVTEMGKARQQAVILGCTELVLLVDPGANVIPVYDTTALHAAAAARWIMEEV
ncbi:MAG: aspartate racemase [Sphingomonadales bacterium]|nr:aspartate racemase [Sphingomonadales bacterium]